MRGEMILSNYKSCAPKTLKPYETRVYLWEE